MSDAYDAALRKQARKIAIDLEFTFIREGVYVYQIGPCFESVAECRMLKGMGADVTGKQGK